MYVFHRNEQVQILNKLLVQMERNNTPHTLGCYLQFRKMTQLFLIFKELQDLQQSMPPTEANTDLLNTLKVKKTMHIDAIIKA